MSTSVRDALLAGSRRLFASYKSFADQAMAACSDSQLFAAVDGSNSIACIVRHMSGNMLSRWTDFLTSDGEKPGRDRDAEFEGTYRDRQELLADWERGWACLFAALDGITEQDLERTVTIRTEPLLVADAIMRQVAHYSYHVGQIVYHAKAQRGADFPSLSIARGASKTYNEIMARKP